MRTTTATFMCLGTAALAAPAFNGTLSTLPPTAGESTAIADNAPLVASLLTAPTAAHRLKLLNESSDWVFDFGHPAATDATTSGKGGHTVKADRLGFPALTGTGVSMTLGFLGPCGFNTPHTHPRSSEINIVVEGSLIAEMIPENGASIVRNRLETWQMTVFPQGALHTEFNPTCNNATFVAGFASEDPGVQQTAQSFLGLDEELVSAALSDGGAINGQFIEQFAKTVPKNVAEGVRQCLQTCGIEPASY